MERKEQLTRVFARSIRDILERAQVDFEQVQEIRLRVRGPLLMVSGGREYYLTGDGRLSGEMEQAHVVSREEIRETMEYISSHSLYAFEEEVRQGFLTMQGGHRVGIAGKTILDDGGIRSMKYISFINIRLSHQIRGCADPVMPYLYENGQVLHTLIISPPRCGKTTLLRDIVRQLSNGSCRQPGVTVGVVDERSEIGACCQGVPQNELGIRTDVLDCCPKARGMMMLIRTMSPAVVAVDEIGSREDLEAMEYVMNCGCKVIATVHGDSIEDIQKKPVLQQMVSHKVFERYVILGKKPGKIQEIFDERGTRLYREGAGVC